MNGKVVPAPNSITSVVIVIPDVPTKSTVGSVSRPESAQSNVIVEPHAIVHRPPCGIMLVTGVSSPSLSASGVGRWTIGIIGGAAVSGPVRS